jgi:2,4-dienoyl-CoA reductase-like NADH-dependent reductase (Old Yellow Enzyme family)
MTDLLFSEFKLRNLTLPNRFVMAPMTRSFSPDGVPHEDNASYYARRAQNHVGLILTEGTTVRREAASNDNKVPKFHEDSPLGGWAGVVSAVHGEGGLIAPQLWHTGMMRKPGTGHYPDAVSDSPSGLSHTGSQVTPAPSEEDVADMIAAFADGAADAARLGFDAIEIHGAHGYLIDQFFWGVMNKRNDRYGGDLVQRATIAADIIKACRKAIDATGHDLPIILRFSQWKQQDFTVNLTDSPDEFGRFLNVFKDAGVDCLHCSTRRFWEPGFADHDDSLTLAGWTKKLTGLPTIAVGSVGLSTDFIGAFQGQGSKSQPISVVREKMEAGEFDLIAVGRALLQDPYWVTKIKEGREDDTLDYDAKALGTLY